MDSMYLLFLIIGLLSGGTMGWWINHNTKKMHAQTLLTNQQWLQQWQNESVLKHDALTKEKQQLQGELSQVLQQKAQLQSDLSAQSVQLDTALKLLEEQKKQTQDINLTLKEEFKNMASEILEQKSQLFKSVNKESLGALLNPFAESMREFKSKVEHLNQQHLLHHGELKQQLNQLAQMNSKIGLEAENLVKALKSDTKMQGNWGEMILEKLLENTSLIKNETYFTQESFEIDGSRKVLDVRVALPNQKNIIIDSKVSIVAYQNYVNASDEIIQQKYLKEHLQSIKNHIKNLSSKNYPDVPLNTLDFVILFLPLESAYITAVQNDTHLFSEAFDQKVVLASPSTLLAMLKTIDNVWQQEHQNKNVLEIAKRAGKIHDTFAALLEEITTLDRQFGTAQNSLDKIKIKIQGQQGLLQQVQKIKTLGAPTKKGLTQPWITDDFTQD